MAGLPGWNLTHRPWPPAPAAPRGERVCSAGPGSKGSVYTLTPVRREGF